MRIKIYKALRHLHVINDKNDGHLYLGNWQ